MARYKELELLIRLGEFKEGNDDLSDKAVALNGQIIEFLRQDTRYPASYEESYMQLNDIVSQSY
jgi:type III secretion protein N (ATPase)